MRRRLLPRNDRGASAVEYGLLVAAVAGVVVFILFVFGHFVVDVFDDSCDKVGSKVVNSTC